MQKYFGLQEDLDDLKDLPNELECNFVALAEITYMFLIEDKIVFRKIDLSPNMQGGKNTVTENWPSYIFLCFQ